MFFLLNNYDYLLGWDSFREICEGESWSAFSSTILNERTDIRSSYCTLLVLISFVGNTFMKHVLIVRSADDQSRQYQWVDWHSCLALFSLNPISIKCSRVIYCLMRKEFNSNHLFWTTIHSSNWIRRSLYTICTNKVSECRIRNSYSFQLLAASTEYDRLYWLLWKLTML